MSNYNNAELIYSHSRAKMLDNCQRAYYFNYYGSVGGWRQDATQRTKQIYKLKQLQGLNAILGEAIHAAITQLIINPAMNDLDFKRIINKTIHLSYRNSLDKKQEWLNNHKLFKMLMEIYYFGQIKMETQQAIIDKIEACRTNLCKCKSLFEITSGSNILTIDELKEYAVNGHKTLVRIDALYQTKNTGEYVVVDWKSGKGSAEEIEQVLLYVYMVHKALNVPVEAIEARLEYLLSGDSASFRFNAQDMQFAEKIIVEDINKMQKCLLDVDKNVPLPEVYFPMNKSSRCKYCNYQELCLSNIDLHNNSLAAIS
jgi:hypothetical protein